MESRFLSQKSDGSLVLKKPGERTINLENTKGKLVFIPERMMRRTDFVFVNQKLWMQLCKRRFSGNEWQILCFLVSTAEFRNQCVVTQAAIAEHTGLSKQTVNALVKRLSSEGVIEHVTSRSGKKFWQLSPMICWKGSVAELKSYLHEQLQERVDNAKGK